MWKEVVALACRDSRESQKSSMRIVGDPVKIRTEHLLNASQMGNRFS
jgi:hypothetical protein